MSKRVTVIVEGREYVVEVGDLDGSPIKATVNRRIALSLLGIAALAAAGYSLFRPERDGSFRIVLAARDPGVPNWIDTEGRPFGIVFWRFMLPEGEIATPRAEVVPLDPLAG